MPGGGCQMQITDPGVPDPRADWVNRTIRQAQISEVVKFVLEAAEFVLAAYLLPYVFLVDQL